MLLAIDIGNTQTVLGVYGEGDRVEPSCMWRLATSKNDAADDARAKLLPLIGSAGLGSADVDEAMIASVVPSLTRSWSSAVRSTVDVDVGYCTAQAATAAGLFETTYADPGEIGADRVADAVAARSLYGAPVVVVDFGTATNIEVVDERGVFVGGIIAPGVKTGADALFSQASLLSAVDLEVSPPSDVIGTNREDVIRSGIVYGEADRVDGLLRRVFAQIGRKCPVVATGGLAPLITAHSSEITDVLPELTLEGLRLIACS